MSSVSMTLSVAEVATVRPHGWISEEVRFRNGGVMIPAATHLTVSLDAADGVSFTLSFDDMQSLLDLLAKIRSAGQKAIDQVRSERDA